MQVPSPSRRSSFALLVVALAVSLAGCGMLTDSSDSLPDADAVSSQLDSLETLEATMETGFSNGSDTANSRMRMVQNLRTGEFRSTIIAGPQDGMTMGSNGSAMWIYNRTDATVNIIQLNETLSNQSQSFETVETIFERLQAADQGQSAEVSISQLPVIPRPSGPVTASAESMSLYGNVTLTYEGTASVDGRETYVIHLQPVEEDQLVGNTTMWFDTEWYYPIKTTTTVTIGNESRTSTVTYRNVTFNPEIPSGTFAFDPPANATVETRSAPMSVTYDTRSELADAANLSVPDPELPAEFDFAKGRRSMFDDNETLTLVYTNGTANVSVMKMRTASEPESGERVDIRGRDGRLLDIGENDFVTWECGDHAYTVSGAVGEETVLSIARSIDCA